MPSQTSEAYVWLWLPGSAEPAVAGMVQRSRTRYRFTYAPSYLARHDAISLYQPELPLRPGWIEPLGGLTIAGTLRDAGPDAWGQRVIIQGLFGNPDAVDPGDVDQVTYFLSSASNRIGALDFQESAVTYVERGGSATLDELHGAARNLADGHDLTPEMATALVHGTSVGGARPKVTITDGDMAYIAKLSRSTDPYPVVKAEAVGLELARRVGIDAPASNIISSLGHDILLVERFDRPGAGRRQMMVSGLTMLGLDEMNGRYATYPDLLDVLRRHGSRPERGQAPVRANRVQRRHRQQRRPCPQPCRLLGRQEPRPHPGLRPLPAGTNRRNLSPSHGHRPRRPPRQLAAIVRRFGARLRR